MIACNATDLFNDNWALSRSLNNAFIGPVGVNALVQGALRRVARWPWIDHPTFKLGGGQSTTELIAAHFGVEALFGG